MLRYLPCMAKIYSKYNAKDESKFFHVGYYQNIFLKFKTLYLFLYSLDGSTEMLECRWKFVIFIALSSIGTKLIFI